MEFLGREAMRHPQNWSSFPAGYKELSLLWLYFVPISRCPLTYLLPMYLVTSLWIMLGPAPWPPAKSESWLMNHCRWLQSSILPGQVSNHTCHLNTSPLRFSFATSIQELPDGDCKVDISYQQVVQSSNSVFCCFFFSIQLFIRDSS